MTDDPKPGTTAGEGEGGSATATGTPPVKAAGGSTETTEQKAARLEAEVAEEKRKNAQLLSEKSRVEEQQRQLEDERRRLASVPPTAPDADPRVKRLQELDQWIAQYPNDIGALAAKDALTETLRTQIYNQAVNRLDQELQSFPESRRANIRQRVISGLNRTPQEANAAIEEVEKERLEREKLSKENEELRKDVEAYKSGRQGTGRPSNEGQGSSGATTVTLAQHDAEIDKLERAGDRKGVLKIMSDVNSGKRRIQG